MSVIWIEFFIFFQFVTLIVDIWFFFYLENCYVSNILKCTKFLFGVFVYGNLICLVKAFSNVHIQIRFGAQIINLFYAWILSKTVQVNFKIKKVFKKNAKNIGQYINHSWAEPNRNLILKKWKNNLGLHGVFKKRTINHYKKINVDKRIITSIYSCVDIN